MIIRDCIYIKKSLGKDGRPIDIYKLRTMNLDADTRLDELVNLDIDSFGKILQDPRITSFGKFLRKYWIDELPQLYNLTKGDIKTVGIRPMGERSWQKYPVEIMERALKQKPGLISINLALTRECNFEDRLEHMGNYMKKWEESPFRTDREYLAQIVWNIIFRGARSC